MTATTIAAETSMKTQFSIVVENKAGVLARILGVLGARGMNVELLKVEDNGQPGLALITLVTAGEPRALEQVTEKIGQQVRVLTIGQEPFQEQGDKRTA